MPEGSARVPFHNPRLIVGDGGVARRGGDCDVGGDCPESLALVGISEPELRGLVPAYA